MRKKIPTGTEYSKKFGYVRALREGNRIEVAGTCSISPGGEIVGKGDMYRQTHYSISIIQKAIEELGGTLNSVVRTRIYTTDISQYESIAQAHREYFGGVEPVSTLVEVTKLIHPDLLVEIEATASLDMA